MTNTTAAIMYLGTLKNEAKYATTSTIVGYEGIGEHVYLNA